MNDNLPKSLHTVKVLVNVARYVLKHGPCAADKSRAEAVSDALEILGYAPLHPDTYGLRLAAIKQLGKKG